MLCENISKKLLGKILFGIVIKDETNRFSSGQRVITSTIETQDQSEYTTKSGNTYVFDIELKYLDISFPEFVVMRHKLFSPDEILEMRQTLQRNDERIIH